MGFSLATKEYRLCSLENLPCTHCIQGSLCLSFTNIKLSQQTHFKLPPSYESVKSLTSAEILIISMKRSGGFFISEGFSCSQYPVYLLIVDTDL